MMSSEKTEPKIDPQLRDRLRLPVLALLVAIGSLQVVGDLGHLPALKAVALAWHMSPAPKVFTAQEGFETYSSEFYVEWKDSYHVPHSLRITPKEYYHGVLGPYNRRNAYGAALSYGPVLYANPATRPMFESVSRYALCDKAPILRELGIDAATVYGPVTIRIKPRQILPEHHQWKLDYEISCS